MNGNRESLRKESDGGVGGPSEPLSEVDSVPTAEVVYKGGHCWVEGSKSLEYQGGETGVWWV